MGIYLDNAATSFPKAPGVAKAVYDFMEDIGATAGRGAYQKALQADRFVYEARKVIGNLFNYNDFSRIIFTSNITESLNMAIKGIVKEGDHIITSSLEHNAVWRCIKTLKRDKGITISTVPCTYEGHTNPKDVEGLIKKNTTLIVFNHASNVIGTLQPIREIGEIARKYNIPFLVDAAQTAGVYPIDIHKDNIDLLGFTGHKSLLGPMGTGGLVVNWDGKIDPLKSGGTGGDSAYEYQPDYFPNCLETGTPNVAGIVGLKKAVEYILEEGIDKIYHKKKDLVGYAIKGLRQIEGITIYGPQDAEKIVSVISFNLKGISAEEVAYELDQRYGIMVRSGLHCAPYINKVIDTLDIGTVRIGIGYFNEKKDIDELVSALQKIAEKNK